MLGIFVIAGCVLMTCAGPPISGYSLGTLSGGRGQEYSSGYRTGGFVGMKDSQSDLDDQLGGGSYASTGSHRHSVLAGGGGGGGHQTSGSSYSSDSGYSDASGSAFGGHSTVGNQDALSSPSSSSYPSNDAAHVSSSDLGAGGYTSAGSSPGLGSYSAGAGTSGNHVGTTLIEYAEGAGGHGPSALTLPGKERLPAEYSSSSHPSPSYLSYTHGGPKAPTYASSVSNHRGHGPGPYSSNPSISFMSGGHHGSATSSFYPSDSGHSGMSSGSSYSSVPSLNSILAGMHGNGPSNYIHGGSGHRPSPNHIFSSATNLSPSYSSRGPSSGYYSNSPYPRGGGKIILVKDGGGGNVGHMYPGEQHSYGGGMFGGAGSGYKIRSVSSGPSYGPSVASGYTSSGGYPGAGHSGGNHGGGGLFGFL